MSVAKNTIMNDKNRPEYYQIMNICWIWGGNRMKKNIQGKWYGKILEKLFLRKWKKSPLFSDSQFF